uniref:Protein kinase domain-containing protein n=1 Tax=Panagrolaimus sp. PS1159 TaxID=55785 RepID=A0AC35FR52_9BILA
MGPQPKPRTIAVGAAQVSPKKNPALLQPQQIHHGLPGMGSDIPRGKNAPPHLSPGQMLNGKFRIDKIIGSGGFGQIYKASDELARVSVAIKVVPAEHEPGRMILEQKLAHVSVAIKVVPADHEPGRMILEQKVLSLLRGTKYVPHLLASGMFNGLMYIVMEMLGKNLGELRRKRTDRKFSISTVLRIGLQAVAGLKAVHDVGYLHRDVKPSNIQYLNQNGGFRKERAYAGFRGTMRYVSVKVHDRKEQGPGDDLMSLLYTLIELGEGSLPWKQLNNPEEITQKKRITTFEDMCELFPSSIKSFYQHLKKLKYDQLPDYNLLTYYLQTALPSNMSNESPFDWEENPSISKSFEKSKEDESN